MLVCHPVPDSGFHSVDSSQHYHLADRVLRDCTRPCSEPLQSSGPLCPGPWSARWVPGGAAKGRGSGADQGHHRPDSLVSGGLRAGAAPVQRTHFKRDSGPGLCVHHPQSVPAVLCFGRGGLCHPAGAPAVLRPGDGAGPAGLYSGGDGCRLPLLRQVPHALGGNCPDRETGSD